MEKFNKITVGFVSQTFEKNAAGKFVCTKQEFIATRMQKAKPLLHRSTRISNSR